MMFLEELAARRRFGMKPGLDTIAAICRALGSPERAFKSVHIAGTNGKGAVSAMLDAALRHAGERVMRYTSPHLVKLNERFFLDGAPVNDATLERIAAKVGEVASALDEVTFFESLTAVAFELCREEQVDCAILECGLGGRFDATNVCNSELSIITRIGLDHCDWLGDTVEKIAAEKAGIIKPGVPVVLANNLPSVREVVSRRASEVGAPFYYAPDIADESMIPDDFSLHGSFNRENAVTAIAALRVLGKPVAGFGEVVWPGRFQRVRSFIIDGAHNPPAAKALAETLDAERLSGLNLIAGFCGDKDVVEVLRTLSPFVCRAYAVKTNNPRSLSATEVTEKMHSVGMAAEACPSLSAAIAAVGTAPTLICGSLFLAGEAIVELGAYPWQSPRFDPSEALRSVTPLTDSRRFGKLLRKKETKYA